jgi:hypothetical protein
MAYVNLRIKKVFSIKIVVVEKELSEPELILLLQRLEHGFL